MRVKIVSGVMTGVSGSIIKVDDPDFFGLIWVLVKVDGLVDPVYYIEEELRVMH